MNKTLLIIGVLLLFIVASILLTRPHDSHGTITDFKVKGVPFTFVLVEGDTFTMGCPHPYACVMEEEPRHKVRVNSFYISATEVTLQQFRTFIEATHYQTDADQDGFCLAMVKKQEEVRYGVNWQCDVNGDKQTDDQHPVVFVSWNDAAAYCEWLSKQTGRKYRLPTEAEWEYAAGGGKKTHHTLFAGGKKADDLAWSSDNSNKKTHPVAQKQPNELGLYDMSGNVDEWCNDRYSRDYYQVSPSDNPQGAPRGTYRAVRGGSWYTCSANCFVTERYSEDQDEYRSTVGFRLACSL